MPYLTRFRATGATLTAAAMTLGGFALAPTAAQASQRAAIAGTHPAWAVSSHRVGTAAVTAGTVNARVYLAGQDQAGLTAFASAVASAATITCPIRSKGTFGACNS